MSHVRSQAKEAEKDSLPYLLTLHASRFTDMYAQA